jgi:RNA-binding S4
LEVSRVRIDKFLKVSKIIKRRTVANEAATGGRISVNGKVVKPSYEIKIGDEVEIRFGNNTSRFKIIAIPKGQSCNASDVVEML